MEAGLHAIVLPLLASQSLIAAIYGAITAGVFEEAGRYIAFTRFLKAKREWKGGLAYGIGHGGAESFVIGAFAFAQILDFAIMINSGTFNQVESVLPANTASAIRQALDQPSHLFLLGGIERAFALIIQIALSLVVLYGLAKGKGLEYLLYAVSFHAAVDLPAALYQIKALDIVTAEILIGAFFGAGLYILHRARRFWPSSTQKLT